MQATGEVGVRWAWPGTSWPWLPRHLVCRLGSSSTLPSGGVDVSFHLYPQFSQILPVSQCTTTQVRYPHDAVSTQCMLYKHTPPVLVFQCTIKVRYPHDVVSTLFPVCCTNTLHLLYLIKYQIVI